MTDIAPEPRAAGSHRRSDGRRVRLLLVSLLVVAIAAGAVVATLHWRGEDKKRPAVATKTTHPTPSPSTSAAASTPAASTSGASLPAAPASSSSVLPAATPGTALSSAPAGPSSAGPPPQPAAAHLPLDVLNSTHTSGMAARAAHILTAGGWTVAETGNYPHTLSGTTVYYPAGQLASAQLLANQFPAIRRVISAPAGVSTTDLTLVLAQDWTASGK
jgi:LytR cell envelope-related transcriptional attenuator